ncbi:MAG: phosphoglycerate kinase [Candidatus Rokubacteria bacterium]|nr:phosphoglycerate kinase [Candidatus Rokubacteria bacterium]
MKRTIEEIDLAGHRVFLRVDFNVPLSKDGRVSEDARIRATLPTIELARKAGARVILASHLGRPKGVPDPKYSLRPVAERLGQLLDEAVPLAADCVGPAVEAKARVLRPGGLLLLENLRFHPGEEANDPAFARALAALGDVYVNDAFAAAHRAHASTEGIARYLRPAVAGLLMKRELETLERVCQAPARPLLAILGGAKVSDKLALVESLLALVDRLLIGGGMAFTFLKAQGHEVGRSLLEAALVPAAARLLTSAAARGMEVRLPVDTVVAAAAAAASGEVVPVTAIPADRMGLDIGPATVAAFRAAILESRTVVWNGPMGVFERPPFAAGTLGVARAVAEAPGLTVVGGGDTVAALEQAGVARRIGYLSTGGGAFLEYLEGRTLPGVAALDDRE